MAGLVNSIKNDVKKAGANKSKFIYFRPDQKQRVRFLTDMDDGMEITFHDSFEKSVNVPCQETFDRECPYCEDSDLRTRSQYAWSIYNYESKEVQVFMFPVNNCSPVPGLMAMFDAYGTLLDRDYVISVSGKGPDKTYSVVPMDKNKFRNAKAKPFSENKILEMLDKAFPADTDDDEDDEPKKKSRKPAVPKTKGKAKSKQEPDGDDDWEDEDSGGVDIPDSDELEEMTAKELFGLCRELEIECKPKKPAKYYVDLIEEYRDNKEEDEDDYDDDQDWEDDEDEEPDYESMDAKELFKLCKERKIDVMAKKPAKYYIKQLEEYDKAQDDWSDDDDDNWEDE